MDFHQTKNNVIYKIISLQITNDDGNLKVGLEVQKQDSPNFT